MKLVYSGKLLKLYTNRVRLANKHSVNLEIVRHPGATLIIPFLSNNKIILLKQFRPVVNSFLYELPAGTISEKETALSCAKREILEETGYIAKRLKKLGYVYPVPGYSTEKITIFKATGLSKCRHNREPDEIISLFTVDRAKLKSLFRRGKIRDAKTICALALCRWLG
jgi:ADP-ribose pyrophosphatase